MLKISLRQMQVFLAVARAGSTAAAAGTVGLSQSAVSAALNEMEAALGVRLFDRVGRRLQLNSEGRALRPRMAAVVDAAQAVEHWSEGDALGANSLRIGASTSIGNYLLPALLASYQAQLAEGLRAHWRPEVYIANTQAVAARVLAYELDLGLIEGPSHDAALELMPWREDELVVVAPAMPPWTAESRVDLTALQQVNWLLREEGSGTREAILQALAPHLPQLREGIRLGNSEAIKQAVREGLGLSCLSRMVVADALQLGHVVELQTGWPRLQRPLYLVLHRDKQITPGLERLLAHLRQPLER